MSVLEEIQESTKELTLSQLLEMDVTSDEFWKVYRAVSDKYWTFENPTDMQKCARLLVEWAEKMDADKVIVSVKIIEAIFDMLKSKTKSTKGYVVFSDTQYYFDIYETENGKDGLNSMLAKASKSINSGNFKVSDSKKDQFGKKYFKKD